MHGKIDYKNYGCQYHLFPRLSHSFLSSKDHLSSQQRHEYCNRLIARLKVLKDQNIVNASEMEIFK